MTNFNNPEYYASFRPIEEDNHDDGTPRSKGSAFDLKSRVGKKEDEKQFRNHDVIKRSTGTVYLRKDNATYDVEPEPKKEPVLNADGTVKRGRGRPPGKYGSYKKKIQEALKEHSFSSKDQLDELSSLALTNYIGKAALRNATNNDNHDEKMKAIRRTSKIHNAARKIAKKAQWAEEVETPIEEETVQPVKNNTVSYDIDKLSFSSIVNSALDTTKGN